MKVFLTGANGFIGKNLKNNLIKNNYEVNIINREIFASKNESDLNNFIEKSNIEKNSVLIHLAATGVTTQCSLEENLLVNVFYMRRLIESFFFKGLKNFLIIGSCFEYGSSGNKQLLVSPSTELEPIGYHSISKAMGYFECKEFALSKEVNVTYARLFQVYGKGENSSRLYPSLISAGLKGEDFKMSSGNQIRDFTHVNDVVKALVNEINLLSNWQVINICSGIGTTVKEFANFHWSNINAKGKLIFGKISTKDEKLMRLVGEISNDKKRGLIKPFYLNHQN